MLFSRLLYDRSLSDKSSKRSFSIDVFWDLFGCGFSPPLIDIKLGRKFHDIALWVFSNEAKASERKNLNFTAIWCFWFSGMTSVMLKFVKNFHFIFFNAEF